MFYFIKQYIISIQGVYTIKITCFSIQARVHFFLALVQENVV